MSESLVLSGVVKEGKKTREGTERGKERKKEKKGQKTETRKRKKEGGRTIPLAELFKRHW